MAIAAESSQITGKVVSADAMSRAIYEITPPNHGRFFPGARFFAFPENPLGRHTGELYKVALVTELCEIVLVESDDLLELMPFVKKDSLASSEEAESLARLLLPLLRISDVMNKGYEDGANIIESLDDVEFTSTVERLDVGARVLVERPRVMFSGHKLTYEFHSWERVGSGAILANTLAVDLMEGAKLEWRILAQRVGLWRMVK